MLQPTSPFPSEENLKTRNDILKMKLMPEHGASFYSDPGFKSDPAMEHEFLKHVSEFEDQHERKPKITVFDRIGKPACIPKVYEIPVTRLDQELEKIMGHLHKHGIHLSVMSPNISKAKIYRFITEELMGMEMVDYESPGIYCFVYDEFHPDPYYDNECMAVDYCIKQILQKHEELFLIPTSSFLDFNEFKGMSVNSFTALIRRFKTRYKDIASLSVNVDRTTIKDDLCQVTGVHETGLCLEEQCSICRGDWLVEFKRNEDNLWEIFNIRIDGIIF